MSLSRRKFEHLVALAGHGLGSFPGEVQGNLPSIIVCVCGGEAQSSEPLISQ